MVSEEYNLLPDVYQAQAMRHVMESAETTERAFVLGALGLVREASEAMEIVERSLFFGQHMSREKLTEELGDTLWYMSLLAHTAGIRLSEVFANNVEKLNARYPDGKYDHEAWMADRRARGVEE